MTNILLNIYEFDAPWAFETLRNHLIPGGRAAVLTMSHGAEIPDAKSWENAYGPGGPIRRDLVRAFGAYGISESDISFISWYHDTPDTAREKIAAADILFLTGGLPDVFFERMQALRLTEQIQKFPGVVMGASAGAMVQFREYHVTPDEDYDAYGYYGGLGLLDGFELEVHFAGTAVQKASIERYQAERGKTVYAMENRGGLVVCGGTIAAMGAVTVFPGRRP